ncbi:MAG: hypothetical protein M0002_02620 [Rhodospirillales bacterium]|nr:hypothetical protein [Rhodospirillales bacterium]
MIQLITADRYGAFLTDLAEMHRLRYRIFKERLGWDVEVSDDMEVDEFDACRPAHLLQKDDGRIQGCVRLLPTVGPTMLRETFPVLLDGEPAPARHTVWESSRFGVDLGSRAERTGRSIARATFELFDGMIEFGLLRQLTDIVTVTDARMERILCRANWPLRRLGPLKAIGKTLAVAGYLEVSHQRLTRVREAGCLSDAVIRMPSDDSSPTGARGVIGAAAQIAIGSRQRRRTTTENAKRHRSKANWLAHHTGPGCPSHRGKRLVAFAWCADHGDPRSHVSRGLGDRGQLHAGGQVTRDQHFHGESSGRTIRR